MSYLPTSKNNYLAFHGLAGYLWCNNYSTVKMAKKLQLSESEWNAISEISETFQTSYSERCNATDYFKANIKSEKAFWDFWEQIKAGKSDFEFSNDHHSPIFIGRAI